MKSYATFDERPPAEQDREEQRLEAQFREFRKVEMDRLEKAGLRDARSVLDLGCGPGFVTEEIASRLGLAGRVVGVDGSAEMIRRASAHRKKSRSLSFQQADAGRLPFEDGAFDLVYSRFLFQHLSDPEAVAREVRRVLAPAGRLVLVDVDDTWTRLEPPCEAFDRLQVRAWEEKRAVGADRRVARRLPHVLKAAGFASVDVDLVPVTSLGMGMKKWLGLAAEVKAELLPEGEGRGYLSDIEDHLLRHRAEDTWGLATIFWVEAGARRQVAPPVTVKKVEDAAERARVQRLWYRVYHEELQREFAARQGDHAQRILVDPLDDQPGTRIFYVEDGGEVTGTARLAVFEPGRIPPEVVHHYHLDRFPGLDSVRVAEAGRFVMPSQARGQDLRAPLFETVFQEILRSGAGVVFLYSALNLARSYLNYGFRPYLEVPVLGDEEPRIALFAIPSDWAHLARIGSRFAEPARLFFAANPDLVVDVAPFEEAVLRARHVWKTDADEIWERLLETVQRQDPDDFFRVLNHHRFGLLGKRQLLVSYRAGQRFIHEGAEARETFYILDGECEVTRRDPDTGERRVLAMRRKGDLVGELAQLGPLGRRVADVTATTDVTLLQFSMGDLTRMVRTDPEDAAEMLLSLCRVLARKLAEASMKR